MVAKFTCKKKFVESNTNLSVFSATARFHGWNSITPIASTYILLASVSFSNSNVGGSSRGIPLLVLKAQW